MGSLVVVSRSSRLYHTEYDCSKICRHERRHERSYSYHCPFHQAYVHPNFYLRHGLYIHRSHQTLLELCIARNEHEESRSAWKLKQSSAIRSNGHTRFTSEEDGNRTVNGRLGQPRMNDEASRRAFCRLISASFSHFGLCPANIHSLRYFQVFPFFSGFTANPDLQHWSRYTVL